MQERLRRCGFHESHTGSHMCRWHHGNLILDVMPSNSKVLGHSANSWYPAVCADARRVALPSGRTLQVASAPLFVATKFEAFHGRGDGDFEHHDIEDIVNVVDGREELLDEVTHAATDLRTYLREEFESLVTTDAFVDAIPRHFATDRISQARAGVVWGRLRRLAGY